jgi:DegV family protein with EDD domain
MSVAVLARLDGRELARGLHAGIRRLLQQQEHLDKINVFPVPDGDTGTNLAITMRAVLGVLGAGPVAHAGQVLTRVADAALDGARGNSGSILAQFFLGVGDRAGHLAELSPRDFAEAVQSGATYARDALAEPREGTILTVLQDFAAEVRAHANAGLDDFRELVRRGLDRAHRSLDGTKQQLDSLKKADVVDAGAAGFVVLLEGFNEYLETGELDESAPLPAAEHAGEEHAAGAEESLSHRWCTECVVTGDEIDRRHLRERLAAIGSSLVVAGTNRKTRVHVHANDPAEVFRIAGEYGDVHGQKADDMQRQQEAAHHTSRRRVAVVVDSASDIPEDELERLDIHLVPVRVNFGEHSYLDKVGLSAEQFFELLASSPHPPKTSQPPPGDFRRLYEFLASHYESVVSVNLTGRASGTRQAAEAAVARVAAKDRVTVVDSRNASLGQGLVAMYAAECADAGMDMAQVVAAVNGVLPKTWTWACLQTLDYAVRGGRVPPAAKRVADWLRLSPLVASLPDGRVGIGGVLIGRRGLTSKFARFVRRRMDPSKRYRLLVGHANAAAEGRRLLEEITAGRPNVAGSWLLPLGAALSVHGGPGMLAVGLQEYEPPRARSGAD